MWSFDFESSHIYGLKNIYSIFVNEKFVIVHSLYMDAHCSSLLCNCHGENFTLRLHIFAAFVSISLVI